MESRLAARRSERAALSSRTASSDCSGVSEHPTLSKGAFHDGSRNGSATARLLLSDDEDIDRYPKSPQRPPQSDRIETVLSQLILRDGPLL